MHEDESYTACLTARDWAKACPRRMEAKLAGAPDKVSVRLYLCRYPERIQPREKWKMANVTYRQHITLISTVLNGDCLKRSAAQVRLWEL